MSNEDQSSGVKEDQPHLIGLPGGKWKLWRWVALRGAGLPAHHVLKLASRKCAERADEFLDAGEAAERKLEETLKALRGSLNDDDQKRRARIVNLIRRLRKGGLPEDHSLGGALGRDVEEFKASCERVEKAWDRLLLSFEDAAAQASQAIGEIAGTNLFREAVIWQNRRAYHTAISSLPDDADGREMKRNKKRRRQDELAAIYLQRYSVKNDTIGFFGPVGWARLSHATEAISLSSGPQLLESRSVYFDGWCIDALAEALNKDEPVRPWAAPRVLPFIRIEGNTLHHPSKGSFQLSREEAAVLPVVDGKKTARQIAEEIITASTPGLEKEADVFSLLEDMHDKEIISWKLGVSWTVPAPQEWRVEKNLWRALDLIGDERLRERCSAALAKLQSARDNVACAAGDAEKLDRALAELEAAFTRLTGQMPTRAEGEMYAGRTLVYEDCRRDIEVEIGSRIMESLGPPLTLILTSARWFTSKIAEMYREAFAELYEEMVEESGRSEVDFLSFWSRVQPLIYGDKRRIISVVLSELQRRWSELLAMETAEQRVNYSAGQLRAAVLAAFDTPDPGWQYARYNSPDVMIAASSVEAIRRGDYQLVLGEFHVAVNTIGNMLFVGQHPHPEELYEALEIDLREPRLVPVPPKYIMTSRDYTIFVSARDYRLDFTADPPGAPDGRALPIGSLVVEVRGGKLVVRARDGRAQFDVIEAFGEALSERVSNNFKFINHTDHTPRVSIDRLVVSRETWRFDLSGIEAGMEFAYEKDEATRFIGARRWARNHRLPRFVFAKSTAETKPCYVDFDSPVYVNILAKIIRRTEEGGTITVTEMLPGPDQIWLPDAEGQCYTNELRMVAVESL